MPSSPNSASKPPSSTTGSNNNNNNNNNNRNSSPRRRGGPGGPVPVTITSTSPSSSAASEPLSIDMSGLRIHDDTATTTTSSVSGASTASSRRRRRRRNKNSSALAKVENAGGSGGGGGGIPPIPSSSSRKQGKPSDGGKKPAKLQIGLNLDVDLQLKAKLGGDLTLSMVLEEKVKNRTCPELRAPGEGDTISTELFYMRVATLRLRRRWIDPDAALRGQIFLTALSATALLAVGFVLGVLAARLAPSPSGAPCIVVPSQQQPPPLHLSMMSEPLSSSWSSYFWGDGDGGIGFGLGTAAGASGVDLALDSLGNNTSSLY